MDANMAAIKIREMPDFPPSRHDGKDREDGYCQGLDGAGDYDETVRYSGAFGASALKRWNPQRGGFQP